MTDHEETAKFTSSATVLRQEVDGAVVLFNLEDGTYFALDELGARIWDLCDGTRTVTDLTAILHDEYDAPVDTIRQDAQALLAELLDERLLVRIEASR